MILLRTLAFGALLATSAGHPADAGQLLFNTTNLMSTQNNSIDPVNGDGPLAQSFFGGSVDMTLTSIKLGLDITSASLGSFVVTLNQGNGSNMPGLFMATLATIFDNSLSTTSAIYTFSNLALLGQTLVHGKEYWIEITTATTTNAEWYRATTALSPPGVGTTGTFNATGDLVTPGAFTSSGVSLGNPPFVLQVEAPEPASLAVLGAGIAALGWARRRRNAQKA